MTTRRISLNDDSFEGRSASVPSREDMDGRLRVLHGELEVTLEDGTTRRLPFHDDVTPVVFTPAVLALRRPVRLTSAHAVIDLLGTQRRVPLKISPYMVFPGSSVTLTPSVHGWVTIDHR